MCGGTIYILPFLSQYLYVPMKESMHLDNLQIGLMASSMGLTSMIFYWPGGWLADRWSPRKLIAVSLIANGALGLWMATLPAFPTLLLIQLATGVILTLTFWSAMIKLVRIIASQDQQALYFGILEGGRNGTTVILVAAGLALFSRLGGRASALQWTIVLFAAALVALGVLAWVALPETRDASADPQESRRAQPLSVAIKRVIRIPAVWLAMGIILCAYVTSAGSVYLTPYATDVYRQTAVMGGVLSMIVTATGIFASPIAGAIADRTTASRSVLWWLLTLALCLSLFVIVPGGARLLPFLLVNSAAIGCAFYALRGIYFALLEEGAVPLDLTGTATGLISLVAYTPDVFIPAFAGYLLDRYPSEATGYRIFFATLMAFAIAGAALTVLFRRMNSTQRTRAPFAAAAEAAE
jgi:nitrate/nitrite transporter NarK